MSTFRLVLQDLDLPKEDVTSMAWVWLLSGMSSGVHIAPLLRERSFGDFDDTDMLNYNQVQTRAYHE